MFASQVSVTIHLNEFSPSVGCRKMDEPEDGISSQALDLVKMTQQALYGMYEGSFYLYRR